MRARMSLSASVRGSCLLAHSKTADASSLETSLCTFCCLSTHTLSSSCVAGKVMMRRRLVSVLVVAMVLV